MSIEIQNSDFSMHELIFVISDYIRFILEIGSPRAGCQI